MNVLGTSEFEMSEVSVYPNPTSDVWSISTINEDITSIAVYDILGKNVLTVSPNSKEAVVDGTELNSGLYFAQVSTSYGVRTFKLLKQ